MKNSCDFGLVGLGVMGRNLLLNAAGKGYKVFGYDLDRSKVNSLLRENNRNFQIQASTDPEELVNSLSKPRKIMLLVPAGNAVESIIENLEPLLDPGDIILDGGNSFYQDTERRQKSLEEKGIHFLGVGVSGGAFGALHGPSMMPGGSKSAYGHVRPILEALASKYRGEPCVAYLGTGSSGHYVKMVHNGIEYGLMQLISESYGFLKCLGNYSNAQFHEIYGEWNSGPLQSYLMEITSAIFAKPDPLGQGALLDQILDRARQKGTGKWTSQNAMDLGIAVPTIDAAVRMREISAAKEMRVEAGKIYEKSNRSTEENLLDITGAALRFGYILTFAQGFHLLNNASETYGYALDLAKVSKIWRSGCIIRSSLLQDIAHAFSGPDSPGHLLLCPAIVDQVRDTLQHTRMMACLAAQNGIAIPAFYSALAYFDAFTTADLPINLVQAQRDFFGSHTYERKDREGNFSTEW
ncbi:NADP-dependent phosphogluconate dehydrogenase [Lentiprolixibacter aurantiacus]|uniref:6-phosphogluconate dehydrogenase, decarboxylating n=1 Tax=Lentiprolixibacter aurantiacus TaxID=2993939 RepID=A0AAE3SNX1_9FLAO|nr:NADP-dependent phosphogluconate dehydrogenase [Lentiprolixibacter aurantiacus]MCX2720222.1 NADP-dependent phosphogluconate dehydrogenase [Lentiprolixibacter aurantiacus]